MGQLELLPPETVEATPFSVRLAQRHLGDLEDRRLTERAAAAPADRRAHRRRSADDLGWLSAVRLAGCNGDHVRLVDLSEGGALIEVNAPLRPGVLLTLEMTGPGLETAVPLEVLRCYIANIHGQSTVYRGACVFAHLIDVPTRPPQAALSPAAAWAAAPPANFVGTEAALTFLLERCAASTAATAPGTPNLPLARSEVIHVLDALRSRTSMPTSDLLGRFTADLLSAILPALRGGARQDVAHAALEARMRSLPRRWREALQPTAERLTSLVDHCATPANVVVTTPALVASAGVAAETVAPQRRGHVLRR